MSRKTGFSGGRGGKAFTLVDLLATLIVTGGIIWHGGGLFQTRERARLASCKANVSAIGKALAIYSSASKDNWPWLVSNNKWDAATGAARQTEPSEKTDYNVTALLFLLVRDGQGPGIFVCPSTTQDKIDPNTKIVQDGKPAFAWDFTPYYDGNAEHESYSYQAPLVEGKETASGATSSSQSGLIVLADRTPAYAGLKPDFDWTSADKGNPKTGMSQNHNGGEMINLLFADLHVGDSVGRADIGINNDNIYSAAGVGKDGKALDENPGAGVMTLSSHTSTTDSFLIGPVKMDKPADKDKK